MACDAGLNQADPTSSEVWAPTCSARFGADARRRRGLAVADAPSNSRGRRGGRRRASSCVRHDRANAISPLSAFLLDRSNPELAVSTALSGIKESPLGIQSVEPNASASWCGAGTTGRDRPDDQWLRRVGADRLGASEAIEAIRDASAGCVDISIVGDVEDVEIALGLRFVVLHLHRTIGAYRQMASPG